MTICLHARESPCAWPHEVLATSNTASGMRDGIRLAISAWRGSDLERLTQWGQDHLPGTGESTMPGMALFACAAAGLWVAFPAPLPFEDEFTIADRPMLRQLARLDDDYTNALLVRSIPERHGSMKWS